MFLARNIQSPKFHAYSCRIQILSRIFRCSHRWEVLAIIFLPSHKKLWPKYLTPHFLQTVVHFSHLYFIHSTVVLPATHLSTPIQLSSSSLPWWQLYPFPIPTHRLQYNALVAAPPNLNTAPFGRGIFVLCCSLISIFVSNKPIMNIEHEPFQTFSTNLIIAISE